MTDAKNNDTSESHNTLENETKEKQNTGILSEQSLKKYKDFYKNAVSAISPDKNATINEKWKPSFNQMADLVKLRYSEHLYVQIVWFRGIAFFFLNFLMLAETIALFVLIFLSSLHKLDLDKVTLNIVVGATLTQISLMVIWIIKSVFPPNLNNIFIPEKNETIPNMKGKVHSEALSSSLNSEKF